MQLVVASADIVCHPHLGSEATRTKEDAQYNVCHLSCAVAVGGASGRGRDRAEWTGHAEVVVSRWELVMFSRALMSGMTGCVAEWMA